MDDSPWWMDSRYIGTRPTDIKATWHPHDLSKLQGILRGNILHPTIGPGQWNPYMGKILQNTFIRIFPIRKHLLAQEIEVGSTLL